MRLVTFDDGRVGELRDDTVVELDVTSMREYFERGGDVRPTGHEIALECRLDWTPAYLFQHVNHRLLYGTKGAHAWATARIAPENSFPQARV